MAQQDQAAAVVVVVVAQVAHHLAQPAALACRAVFPAHLSAMAAAALQRPAMVQGQMAPQTEAKAVAVAMAPSHRLRPFTPTVDLAELVS